MELLPAVGRLRLSHGGLEEAEVTHALFPAVEVDLLAVQEQDVLQV